KCALVCPHAAIRAKVYPAPALAGAPATFKSVDYRGNEYKGDKYTIQVAPEDCTGCNLCVTVCPAKDKTNPRHKAIDMHPQPPLRDAEVENYDFFLALPEVDRTTVRHDVKGPQFLQPLFEYSGACAGCGETPYLKLATQLFGDRMLMANATGCSSIYGGNLPTTPYTTNGDGRGPAWANSLFEDNAEFGLGMRFALDSLSKQARTLLAGLASRLGDTFVTALLDADQSTEAGIAAQREKVVALRAKLAEIGGAQAARLAQVADYLVRKNVGNGGRRGAGHDHGIGRPGPRPLDWPRREHSRAGHRGVLQHRGAGIEGDAARCVGEVRGRGEGNRQEGPRHDGDDVRPRVRRTRRLRRARHADGHRLP